MIPRIGAALALLLSFLAPSLVCALPISMTASERACCQDMQGECGGMKMPASHSCCRHDIGPSHVDAKQPESRAFDRVILLPAVLPQSIPLHPPTFVGEWIAAPDHSPPIPSVPTISILRI